MAQLNIEIVSDPVCPWCYIGKRRLEQALAARTHVQANLHWSPYQLSPDMPMEGADRQAHYAQIFGEERARTIMASMAETARAEGLEFQQLPGARSPNTLRAHVLMQIVQEQGGDSGLLAEKLFHAHHVDCRDISDPEVLAAAAAAAGLDPEQVKGQLDAPEHVEVVQAQLEQAQARGVSGVPFFIFNDRYAVSGAQPADAFGQVIDRLTA